MLKNCFGWYRYFGLVPKWIASFSLMTDIFSCGPCGGHGYSNVFLIFCVAI